MVKSPGALPLSGHRPGSNGEYGNVWRAGSAYLEITGKHLLAIAEEMEVISVTASYSTNFEERPHLLDTIRPDGVFVADAPYVGTTPPAGRGVAAPILDQD